jgi:hypothetical protein
MRERARHLRRQRRCRPGPDGGWQVYARFPLTVTGLTAPGLSGDRGCPPRAEGLPAGPPGLIASGMTNPGIAAELYLSFPTVKSHINRIFAKTGSGDRAAAIR